MVSGFEISVSGDLVVLGLEVRESGNLFVARITETPVAETEIEGSGDLLVAGITLLV